MLHRLWTLVSFPLMVIVVIAAISTLLLGVGTLLTFLFAVTVWEATIVVTVVSAGAVWFIAAFSPSSIGEELFVEPFEDGEEPRITITTPLGPSNRSRRRRRR